MSQRDKNNIPPICETDILAFREHLVEKNLTPTTVQKYVSDLRTFIEWCNNAPITQALCDDYVQYMLTKRTESSANTVVATLNVFFKFTDTPIKIKYVKLTKGKLEQQSKEKELSHADYERLLIATRLKNNEQMYLLLQTLYTIGLRSSELQHITVEAIQTGITQITSNRKTRNVYIPQPLGERLLSFAAKNGITSGSVFIAPQGSPCGKSYIFYNVKILCKLAELSEEKAFPDNIYRLFERENRLKQGTKLTSTRQSKKKLSKEEYIRLLQETQCDSEKLMSLILHLFDIQASELPFAI